MCAAYRNFVRSNYSVCTQGSDIIKLKPTKSELSLKLEQLRFLENNYSIYVSEYDEQIPNGIDTQEDVENALNFLKNENL